MWPFGPLVFRLIRLGLAGEVALCSHDPKTVHYTPLQNEAEGSDILRQALENSGLPSGSEAVQSASGTQTTTSVSIATSTEPQPIAPTASQTLTVAPLNNSVVSTVTVHDVATGSVKKHIIRKVSTVCPQHFAKSVIY